MASVITNRKQRRYRQRDAACVSTPDGTIGVGLHEVPDAIADAQRALNLSDKQLARRAGIPLKSLLRLKNPTGYLVVRQRPMLYKVLAYLEAV